MRFRGASVVLGCAAALVAAGSARAAFTAVAVQPSASSVRISWQSSRAVRAVVELGVDADYAIWSSPVMGKAVQVSIGGLEPSTSYRFRIRSAGQQVKGSFRTQAAASSPRASVSTGTILLDGQPFFPRMVWNQCPGD